MIRSMTGYGQAERSSRGIRLQVDMKSVNHRYGETVFRMPREWITYEDKLRKAVQQQVKRGRVDVFITAERQESMDAGQVAVDWTLADGYRAASAELKKRYALDDELTLKDWLSLPDLITVNQAITADEQWEQLLLSSLDDALNQLIEMREAEGRHLFKDLQARLSVARQLHRQAVEAAPRVVEQYRSKLRQRIDELLDDRTAKMDETRITLEVALLAERSNIDEELTRLNSHFQQFSHLLSVQEPVGRKLDFLLQEMNREINTIGSKANQSELVNIVVDLKAELEKMREQVQNVE